MNGVRDRSGMKTHIWRIVIGALFVSAGGVGLVVWLRGDGAAIIVVAALLLGIWLCAGRVGYPAATAIVFVWTLAVWMLVGELVRAAPTSSTAWGWVFLVAACMPMVIGIIVRLVVRGDGVRLAHELRLRPELILGALAGTLAMAFSVALAYKRFGGNGMAWALSGDSRNTIQSAGDMFPTISGGQGLIVDPTMTLYSALAVVGSRPDATFSSGAALLDHAILTLSTFEFGVIALITIASAGLLVQVAGARRVPVFAVIGASLAPLLGIGIGIGLQDGFVSAFLAIALVTLSFTLAALAVKRETRPGVRLLSLATIAMVVALLLFTWAYAIVAVVPALVFVLILSWRAWSKWMRIIVLGAGVVALLGLASFMPRWIHHTLDNNVFGMSGTIVSPTPWLLILLPLTFLLCAMWRGHRETRQIFVIVAVTGVLVASMVVFICYIPEGPPGYPYYAAKLTWIWAASVLGLVFVPAALAFGRRESATIAKPQWFGSESAAKATGGVLLTLLVLLGVRFASPLESPVFVVQPLPLSIASPIADGWVNPSAGAVGIARRAAEVDNAVVFGVADPGNDRLANFWLNVIPSNQGVDFKGWAYYTTGEITSLCDLLNRDSSRTVVTVDAGLAERVKDDCQIANPKIVIIG